MTFKQHSEKKEGKERTKRQQRQRRQGHHFSTGMRCSKGRAAIGIVIFAPFPVSKSTSSTRRRSLSCWRVVTSGVTHGLRFASCSSSWRIPQFEDGANGWSRRPVALRTASYPHHREHPAVKLGRRGTHRAAQKGAQAQRAVVVELDSQRK